MTGITYQTALAIFYLIMMNIYGHLSEPIIRRKYCNYHLTSPIFHLSWCFCYFPHFFIPLLSQSLIYLNSVRLMSIMDHYGYTTRPLVEFNLNLFTERASFLGWLSHMSERKRLAITLDPAASELARFKNKRIQTSGDLMKGEPEPEAVPTSPSSSTKPSSPAKSSSKSHPFSLKTTARKTERKMEADSEDEYKPPVKVAKAKPKRSSPRSKAGKTKLNTSAYGKVTDVGGKCPRYQYEDKGEASDSDSLKSRRDDKEDHSDSFTDS